MLAAPERIRISADSGVCRKSPPAFGGVTPGLSAGGKGDDGKKGLCSTDTNPFSSVLPDE
jgi:hypothetical protein